MANVPIVRPISIKVNGQKVAEATGGSFKVVTGTERIPTDDAAPTFTLGRIMSDVTWKTVVPSAGMRARVMELILNQLPVTIAFNMDSKSYAIDGKITAGGVDWDHATGKLEGDWTFMGGPPIVSG